LCTFPPPATPLPSPVPLSPPPLATLLPLGPLLFLLCLYDYPVKKEDFADALPQQSHLFKVRKPPHGKVVLPEAFVAHKEGNAQRRAQQQKSNTYREDQFQEQHRSDACKGTGGRDALAKAFGISTDEIAQQQQAFNYAELTKRKKEIEEPKYQGRKEIQEEVEKQRQMLEEIKQQREKLNKQQKDAQQNAAAAGAGMNIPSVQVLTSGTHPSHRGPGLTHQHTQPSSRPSHSGGHLGPPQYSLDESHTSSSSNCPPAHQLSHEYEYIRDKTSSEIQGQGNSREEDLYDHIGTRRFHGLQPGAQPLLLLSKQRASQHQALPHSAPPLPSHHRPQPTPSHYWDQHQNQFFPAQTPYAFTGSSQQGEVQLSELGVGSTVQISDPPRYGVIKWIGELPNIQGPMAGVELVRVTKLCSDKSHIRLCLHVISLIFRRSIWKDVLMASGKRGSTSRAPMAEVSSVPTTT